MKGSFVRFFFVVIFLTIIGFDLSAADKPLIGLTTSYKQEKIQLNYDYVEAVVANGGIPIILPPTTDEIVINKYVDLVDAVVLTGGWDIPPEAYGQKAHPTTSLMDSQRYEFERHFIPAFLKSGKPTLGICLGMQFSNVVMGGTLYQDIPSMIGSDVCHRNGEMYSNFHQIGIAKGSQLEKILGTTSEKVISRHHQSIDKLGTGLNAVARTSDGVIEAIERTDGPFGIFVQWHPESMKKADPEHRNRLFSALINAALKKN